MNTPAPDEHFIILDSADRRYTLRVSAEDMAAVQEASRRELAPGERVEFSFTLDADPPADPAEPLDATVTVTYKAPERPPYRNRAVVVYGGGHEEEG